MAAVKLLQAIAATMALLLMTGSMAAKEAKEPSIRNIEAAEAAKVIAKQKHLVILDVRTPQEFAAGHIPGAVNVDFNAADFQKRLAALDRGKEFLIYCASGRRSAGTREKMRELKFSSIYHLEGGFRAWERAGQKTEK